MPFPVCVSQLLGADSAAEVTSCHRRPPGAVARSEDMVEWEDIDKLDTPTWGTPGAKLWAPCLAKFGDTYNLYYALSTWGDPNPGIGVMVADSPAGPFTASRRLSREFVSCPLISSSMLS